MSLIEIAFIAGSSLGGMLSFMLAWRAVAWIKGRKVRRSGAEAKDAVLTGSPTAASPAIEAGMALAVDDAEVETSEIEMVEAAADVDEPEDPSGDTQEPVEAPLDAVADGSAPDTAQELIGVTEQRRMAEPTSTYSPSHNDDTPHDLNEDEEVVEVLRDFGLDALAPGDADDGAPDPEAVAALAVRLAAIEEQLVSGRMPSLSALAAEIEAYRSVTQALGEQMAVIADRLGALEAAGPVQYEAALEARIDSSLEEAMRRINELHADVESAVETRMAPLFGRLEAFEAERALLMRTVNLAPMRAFATLQVEVDALTERIATLTALHSDLPALADDLVDDSFLSVPSPMRSSLESS